MRGALGSAFAHLARDAAQGKPFAPSVIEAAFMAAAELLESPEFWRELEAPPAPRAPRLVVRSKRKRARVDRSAADEDQRLAKLKRFLDGSGNPGKP